MMLEKLPSISYGSMATPGNSPCADLVTKLIDESKHQMQTTVTFGSAYDELRKVFWDCQHPNWDGYDAAAVLKETFMLATKFLSALPLGMPVPSIGAEPDGDITLEWYRTPRNTLSVSVSPSRVLHYAALLGPSNRYGSEPFGGDVPDIILDLIYQVMPS